MTAADFFQTLLYGVAIGMLFSVSLRWLGAKFRRKEPGITPSSETGDYEQ